MMTIAHRVLCQLDNRRLGVAQHEHQRLNVTVEFVFQSLAGHAIRRPALCTMVRLGVLSPPHEQCDTNRALIADDRDLGGSAVFHYVQKEDDASWRTRLRRAGRAFTREVN
jgi:hypothetical protein